MRSITGIENIEALMDEVTHLKSLHEDILDHLDEACASEHRKMKAIDEEIERLKESRESVYAEMRERDPQAFEDQASLGASIKHKEEALKRACHAIPVEELRKGAKFSHGGLDIAISKVSTKVHYSTDVLKTYPELAALALDGDPLVHRAIDAGVMERLVADNRVSLQKVQDYRYETKVRNPSVRITESVNE